MRCCIRRTLLILLFYFLFSSFPRFFLSIFPLIHLAFTKSAPGLREWFLHSVILCLALFPTIGGSTSTTCFSRFSWGRLFYLQVRRFYAEVLNNLLAQLMAWITQQFTIFTFNEKLHLNLLNALMNYLWWTLWSLIEETPVESTEIKFALSEKKMEIRKNYSFKKGTGKNYFLKKATEYNYLKNYFHWFLICSCTLSFILFCSLS